MTAAGRPVTVKGMDISMQLQTVRNARVASAVALAGFIGFLAVPSVLRPAVVVVMVAAAAAVVLCSAAWMRTPAGSRPTGIVAIASAVGLVGSVAYLSAIADEPAAIPIVGTLVLLLSLVGLIVSVVALREA
jgi:hypothetical protein